MYCVVCWNTAILSPLHGEVAYCLVSVNLGILHLCSRGPLRMVQSLPQGLYRYQSLYFSELAATVSDSLYCLWLRLLVQ